MRLKLDNRAPVYVQVIDYFRQQIASGSLAMGEEIPSRRELANELKINPNTVQRAYREMEEQGLIYTDGNMPSKITTDSQVIKVVRNTLLTDALAEFITSVKALHISLEEVIPLLEASFNKEGSDD